MNVTPETIRRAKRLSELTSEEFIAVSKDPAKVDILCKHIRTVADTLVKEAEVVTVT